MTKRLKQLLKHELPHRVRLSFGILRCGACGASKSGALATRGWILCHVRHEKHK